MRWITSTESCPDTAMSAAVPFEKLSNEFHFERKADYRKRSSSSDVRTHLTEIKRKCSRLRDFSGVYSSSGFPVTDGVQHSKSKNELGVTSGVSMCIDAVYGPSQFQSSEETRMREKEKYVLQIQRTMIADEDGDRPIHISVVQEDVNLIQRLCKLMKDIGASLDIFNHLRQTPLHLAVIVGNPSIIKILLQHGASVNVRDRNGSNAVQLAVKYFREECFQVLLEDPNSRSALDSLDYEGLSAVHHAVINGNSSAVNLLYHHGADVNSIDGKSGRSALIQAVLSGNVEMVCLLLECGAFVAKMDYSGLSALDVAHQIKSNEIIQLLEKTTVTKQDNDKEAEARTHSAGSSTITLQAPQKRKHKEEVSSTAKLSIRTRKQSVTQFHGKTKRNCIL